MNTGSITVTFPLPLSPEQAAVIAPLLGAGGDAAAAPRRGRPPKAEAAAVEPAKAAEPAMPAEAFSARLDAAVKALGAGGVKEVFAKFGAKKFSDIKPADYAKVAAALDEAATASSDLTS